MKKICIITYYGLNESLGCAAESLRKYNYEVSDYPLLKYINERVPNYIENLINFINENNINYVLWWCMNISTNDFGKIKDGTKAKFLFYNWDEPYNWKHLDLHNKAKYIDAAFISCDETRSRYCNRGTKIAECLYPSFDQKMFYPIKDINDFEFQEYSCDISICITNLYDNELEYPDQYINRKLLIDAVYENQKKYNYTFNIYGPEKLKHLYPLSYKKFIKYDQLNYVFNYSKINLCTHVLSNKKGYLNERIFLIGASGGLVLCDYVDDMEYVFDLNNEIIVLDKYFYIDQIHKILQNYDDHLQIRQNMNVKCVEKYNYSKWAEFIDTSLKQANL
jgi:hypothetical protein